MGEEKGGVGRRWERKREGWEGGVRGGGRRGKEREEGEREGEGRKLQ